MTTNGPPDLVLAVMPFGLCSIPTIGPATLKACLQQAGKRVRIFDFNLEYLATLDADPNVGWQLHDEIAYLWDFLPGEWLFSPRRSEAEEIAFLVDLAAERIVPGHIIELLGRLRPHADAFAAYAARRLAATGTRVIGFTTSFMQTQPSLAVAAHLKRIDPDVRVLFGGANCFGEMGPALLEAYPQIDAVATGEADATLPAMVEALAAGDMKRAGRLPGYATRHRGVVRATKGLGQPVRMDDLPDPDFSDYFRTKAELEALRGPIRDLPLYLPIETSRGCWWGAKSHCTFCGLNADRMDFRSKSPERAFAEFERQADRYGLTRFFAVDNIVDHAYYGTVLRNLAASPKPYFVHYEIKANLKRSHVDAMRAAGVMKVQPGIEALNTDLLKLMRKGISALQNVQTLKWLTEGGFNVSWFILTGFPGEKLESYHETLKVLRRITHLSPPGNVAPVYIERFSPYQTRPGDFGITLTGHTKWYDHSFPGLTRDQLERIAYRFDYEDPSRDSRIDTLIDQQLRPLVAQWKAGFAAHGPTLHLLNAPEGSALSLGPLGAPERIVLLPDAAAEMLRACDAHRHRDTLLRDKAQSTDWDGMGARALRPDLLHAYVARFAARVQDHRDVETTPEAMLARMIETGLILADAEKVLAMPLHVDRTRLEAVVSLPSPTRNESRACTVPASPSR